jgi:type II secretion system protein G
MPKIKERAFTLIELLIVIAIIGILMTIIFVSFSQAQRSARDAQRKSDLQTVAGALQRFYSDNSHYPISNAAGQIRFKISDCTVSSPDAPLSWGSNPPNFTCNSKNYLKQLPKDPIGAAEYCYSSTGDQNYILYARLEGMTNTYACGSAGITDYNYRVTPND